MLSASRRIIGGELFKTLQGSRNISFHTGGTIGILRTRNPSQCSALCTWKVQLNHSRSCGLPFRIKGCRYLCVNSAEVSAHKHEQDEALPSEIDSTTLNEVEPQPLSSNEIFPLEDGTVLTEELTGYEEKDGLSYSEEEFSRSKANLARVRFVSKENLMDRFRKEYEQSVANDGVLHPMIPYQILRKCSLELGKETPEAKVEAAKEIWQFLSEQGFKFEISHYNALLGVYTANQHEFSPLDFLKEIEESGLQPNTRTLSDLVLAYSQSEDISGALKVMEVLKAQGLPLDSAYSSLVVGYAQNGKLDQAQEVIDQMRTNGITPDANSLKALAVCCAERGLMEEVEKVIDEMYERKIYVDGTPAVKIVDAFGRCGHFELIDKIFEKLGGLHYVGTEMKTLFRTWMNEGNDKAAATLLKNQAYWSGRVEKAQLNATGYFANSLVDRNKPLSEVLEGLEIGEEILQTNTGLEETLKAYHKRQDVDRCLQVIQLMIENKKSVPVYYFYQIFSQMSERKDLQGIHRLLDYITENGIRIDSQAMELILHGFEEPSSSCVEFVEIPKDHSLSLPYDYLLRRRDAALEGDNLHLFTAIASLFTRFGQKEELLNKVDDFLKRTFHPDETAKAIRLLESRNIPRYKIGLMTNSIFDSVIKLFGSERAEDGFTFVKNLTEFEIISMNTGIYSRLLDVLCQKLLSDRFYETIQLMEDYNVPQTRSHKALMLRMAARMENTAEAQQAFDRIEDPDERAYNNLLTAYGKYSKRTIIGDQESPERTMYIRKMIEIYKEMKSKGFVPYNVPISNLIIAYLFEGDIRAADEIKRTYGLGAPWIRNTVYNEYLRAYVRLGRLQAAEKLFAEIKNSEDSNDKLLFFGYHQLLAGYNRSGDIEKMKNLTEEMREDGIRKGEKTTATFVDAYLVRNDLSAAVDVIASITDRRELPPKSFLTPLIRRLVEDGNAEGITKVTNATRDLETQYYNGNHISNFLLLANVRAGNLDAASEILRETEFVKNVRDLFKKSNLPHYVMDLPLLTAYEYHRDIDSAIQLCDEKLASIEAEGDDAFPRSFLLKMAKFAQREGRPLPFSESLFQKFGIRRRRRRFADEDVMDNTSEADGSTQENEKADEDVMENTSEADGSTQENEKADEDVMDNTSEADGSTQENEKDG